MVIIMSPELLHLLRQQIRLSGPLRFDAFMDLALYSDPHGYYRSRVPGADSDYRTSPSLTPWFGKLVARDLQAIWERLGSPEKFSVAEAGAGNADLAAAAVAASAGPFAAALRWVFIEPMPFVASLQKGRLGTSERFSWAESLDDLAPITGVILANEVLDNFAFRVFEVREFGPMEVRVGTSRTALQEVLTPLDADAEILVAPALEHLEVGDRFEIRTGVDRWVADAARTLDRGALLVVDYGDVEPEIWTKRPSGSMVTYRQGLLGLNPVEEVGESDITAHVNFSQLTRAARAAGMLPCPLLTQREWLGSLGLQEAVEEIRQAEAIARFEGRHGDWVGLVAERSRLETLAGRGGLGDYLVFKAVN
jgi:SAM-dependent MidA family methyltransferase